MDEVEGGGDEEVEGEGDEEGDEDCEGGGVALEVEDIAEGVTEGFTLSEGASRICGTGACFAED